ncbi:DUF998 domain-containing protein [Nocardia harenae]|uniref:DUF998 domain-containing protein n=1 Tax=Nocardia harenae TaxID=358707 RepID=UPI00082B4A63|nr:DUF998 domain-containing protein [Nocardia harenae]
MTTTSPPTAVDASAKSLLACGAVAGPLFVSAIVLQAITRTGFDPARHPLSLLALGDFGWLQVANFLLAGALAVAGAAGLHRRFDAGRRWSLVPGLIAAYGVALIWAGVFPADAADGFPPGATETVSWHGVLHSIAPATAGLALVVAAFVGARRFARAGRRGWAAYSVGTALAYLVLSAVAFGLPDYRWMLLGGAMLWLWPSVIAVRALNSAD